MKLAIVSTHPVQYYVPWYQALAKQTDMDLTVYYALIPDSRQQGTGFGIPFAWDIPMLESYKWERLKNTARSPSLEGFFNSRTPSVFSMLANAKPDVAIITGWHAFPLIQALCACVLLRIPRLVRGDSHALRRRKWWKSMLHRFLLRWYSGFLAVGKANREFYQKNGVSPELIFSCLHFVDNSRLGAESRRFFEIRDEIRAGWNIRHDQTVFVYTGKLQPEKQVIDLLRALVIVRQKRQNIHLLIAGTGETERDLRQFVAERRLPVTFGGFLNQSQISRAYVAADCLVLPSASETWGLVVNEAMACGIPAIVSDGVGCAPDLIENGVTGYIFPCGDIESLAGRMAELAADKNKLKAMGNRAYERIQNYSVEKAVEGTLQATAFVRKKAG